MPLPQQVTEQLARVPRRTPGVSGQLLMLTSLLFFLSLATFFGLRYGYKPFLDQEIEKLNTEIDTYAQKIPRDKQTEIINFYSQLVNLETLLKNHIYGSVFFEWLEKNTQVDTYFTDLSFSVSQGELSLTGVSKSIQDIGEQLLVLNKLPEVTKITLGEVSAQENLWHFGLEVSLNSGFLNKVSSSE